MTQTSSLLADLEQNIKMKYCHGMNVCLTCLSALCGRYDRKHALSHYECNKEHSVTIQSKTLNVWCYECDEDLQHLVDLTQGND